MSRVIFKYFRKIYKGLEHRMHTLPFCVCMHTPGGSSKKTVQNTDKTQHSEDKMQCLE